MKRARSRFPHQDPRRDVVARGYDTLAEGYDEWQAATQDDSRTEMLARFVDLVPAGGRVLDVGCGSGMPSTAQLARRFDVTGVDISPGQLAAARRNVPRARFVCADIVSTTFAEESFEGVVALYSVSHIPRSLHGPLLARICSWLTPGGVLLASLGAQDSPDWTGEWLGVPMFFSAWSADVNRALVVDAGLEIISAEVRETIEPEGAVPFLWLLARRPAGGSVPAGGGPVPQ